MLCFWAPTTLPFKKLLHFLLLQTLVNVGHIDSPAAKFPLLHGPWKELIVDWHNGRSRREDPQGVQSQHSAILTDSLQASGSAKRLENISKIY
jgi:hypothetical protein